MLISLAVPAIFAAWTGASSPGPVRENAELKRAEAAVSNLHYDEALSALGRARSVRGNDRATLLRILELQGVVAGQLRKAKISESAFRELLVLDPDHKLGRDYAPRVMTPFYEAKRLVAEKGALVVRATDPEIAGTDVKSVGVSVDSDPLTMLRAVRFHTRAGSAEWHEVLAIPMSGSARTPTAGTEVNWWAELIGDQDAVLALVASAEAPRVEHAVATAVAPSTPEPVVLAPPPPPASVTGSPEGVTASATSGTSGSRVASYFIMGGAVVAGGVGGYFGYQSSQDNNAVKSAVGNGTVVVTAITEKRATDLNAQTKQYATVANVLFGAAGALAIGGIALWFLGGSATVTVQPTGVGVSGSF